MPFTEETAVVGPDMVRVKVIYIESSYEVIEFKPEQNRAERTKLLALAANKLREKIRNVIRNELFKEVKDVAKPTTAGKTS